MHAYSSRERVSHAREGELGRDGEGVGIPRACGFEICI